MKRLCFIMCLLAIVTALVCISYVNAQEAKSDTAPTETIVVLTCLTKEEKPVTEPTEATQEPTEAVELVTYYDVPLSEDLQDHIFRLCEEYEIDPAIVIAICFRESSYRPTVMGDNGNSYGLMQIQLRFFHDRMAKLGCTDLLDPYQNVTVGIDFLAELLERYDGDIAKALTAYNRGSYGGTVTQYAWKVLETAEELRSETYAVQK